MRSLFFALIVSACFSVVACGGGGSGGPDMALCANQACTCTQGTTCVRLIDHVPFCADDCTDDRDCPTGDQCVALFKGNGFLAKQCLRADRFSTCAPWTNCDLTTAPSCEGSTLVSTVHLTDAACGYASVFCPNGCSNAACQ